MDFFPSGPLSFSGSMLVFRCVQWEAAVAWVEKEPCNHSGFIHRCRSFRLVYTHATRTKNMLLSSQTHLIDVLHQQGRFVQNRISAIWHALAKGCAWGNRWALWQSKLKFWPHRSPKFIAQVKGTLTCKKQSHCCWKMQTLTEMKSIENPRPLCFPWALYTCYLGLVCCKTFLCRVMKSVCTDLTHLVKQLYRPSNGLSTKWWLVA